MTPPHPLRIVYLIGQLGLGGSERQLYLLLKHMDKTRFELHVIVFNPSDNYSHDDDLRDEGVSVYAIPGQFSNVFSRILWIYKLLHRIHPHVIHSWSIHDNVYAGLVGWLANVPRRLGSIRGSLGSQDFLNFHPVIRWLILHSVQGHLVNSDAIAAQLKAANIPERMVFTLVNCVSIDDSQPRGQFGGIPSDAQIVGMVGNLRSEKNYPMFVRGMAQVLQEFSNLYGVIIGQAVMASDPEVPQQIQDEIDQLDIREKLLVLGFQSDVPALLSSFNVFCLTSNYEGTPNVVLEAMAAGLPVIATRVGGIPHLVRDGETGFLIDQGDVNGLANSLRVLLRNPHLAHKMGNAGRQRAEVEFACKVIVPHFEAYYLKQFA